MLSIFLQWILSRNPEAFTTFKSSLQFRSGMLMTTATAVKCGYKETLDIGVDLWHPLDILMASFETDSRLSSYLVLAGLYPMHP